MPDFTPVYGELLGIARRYGDTSLLREMLGLGSVNECLPHTVAWLLDAADATTHENRLQALYVALEAIDLQLKNEREDDAA
jgi:hypothetical protein